jgi:sugar/nucleoside kinase (ribokinase family)
MKIAIIGTIIKDTIYPFQGEVVESFGGSFFNIAIASQLIGEKDKIFPVSNVGNDVYDLLIERLKNFPNVDTQGLYKINQPNNAVTLKYYNPESRVEISTNPMPPLTVEQIEKFLNCDAIFINFISGWDISVETVKKIRESTKSYIYIDVHSFVLDIDEDFSDSTKSGKRFPKKSVPEWKELISNADIVQMNESEAGILSGLDMLNEKNLIDFGKDILSIGISVCSITLGSKGSVVFWGDGNYKKINSFHIEKVVDATGCGDAFGSAFIVKYLETYNPVKSAEFANMVAGINCTLKGTNEVEKIKKHLL